MGGYERDRERHGSRHGSRDYDNRGGYRRREDSHSDSQRRRERHHGHSHYDRDHEYSRGRDDRHHRQRSRSRSQERRNQQEMRVEQQEQKIRLAIRNNTINYDPTIHQAYMMLSEQKREELAEQAQSPQRIHECILVRELYVSGMYESTEQDIRQFFSRYGEVQAVQIIKNFIFVKYLKVQDASNACADYHNINTTLHQNNHNSNFKIFFADHLKRFNVVSNNPAYEVAQTLVPVLYASVRNDPQYANEPYLRGIFEKFGFIRNLEIKRNELPTQRTYVLVQYETLNQAMRARERIKMVRDKLGDKKSEITLLIDNDKITRQYPNINNQIRYQRKRQNNTAQQGGQMMQQPQQQHEYNYPMYSQPMGHDQPPPLSSKPSDFDIDGILGIINEHAGGVDQDHQQADWCGFFTLNKHKKIEVDFVSIHKEPLQMDDCILNIAFRADIREALDSKCYNFAGKFRAAQPNQVQQFKQEYIGYFKKKNRAGILMTPKYLIYLIPPLPELNIDYPIRQEELLALFFKLS